MVVRQRRVREQVDPALWRRADMRAALAARDISGVFKLLQRMGVSQRHIAALTGQSQSEISEILAGRQVVSYDVLTRIADGLGIPRGTLGLAYDDETAALLGVAQAATTAVNDPPPDDPAQLVAHLTGLALGSVPTDPHAWVLPVQPSRAQAPDRIGLSDVDRLAAITEQLRAVDREFGGGACRDPALAQLTWAHQLLKARADQPTSDALHRAVADLHLLAGWASFDLGDLAEARRHFARALEHARFVNGAIYSSPNGGVWTVLGEIYKAWQESGLDTGELGLPTSDEYRVPDGWRSDFEFGSLIFNEATGVVTKVLRAYNDAYEQSMQGQPADVAGPAPEDAAAPAPEPAPEPVPVG